MKIAVSAHDVSHSVMPKTSPARKQTTVSNDLTIFVAEAHGDCSPHAFRSEVLESTRVADARDWLMFCACCRAAGADCATAGPASCESSGAKLTRSRPRSPTSIFDCRRRAFGWVKRTSDAILD